MKRNKLIITLLFLAGSLALLTLQSCSSDHKYSEADYQLAREIFENDPDFAASLNIYDDKAIPPGKEITWDEAKQKITPRASNTYSKPPQVPHYIDFDNNDHAVIKKLFDPNRAGRPKVRAYIGIEEVMYQGKLVPSYTVIFVDTKKDTCNSDSVFTDTPNKKGNVYNVGAACPPACDNGRPMRVNGNWVGGARLARESYNQYNQNLDDKLRDSIFCK